MLLLAAAVDLASASSAYIAPANTPGAKKTGPRSSVSGLDVEALNQDPWWWS